MTGDKPAESPWTAILLSTATDRKTKSLCREVNTWFKEHGNLEAGAAAVIKKAYDQIAALDHAMKTVKETADALQGIPLEVGGEDMPCMTAMDTDVADEASNQ